MQNPLSKSSASTSVGRSINPVLLLVPGTQTCVFAEAVHRSTLYHDCFTLADRYLLTYISRILETIVIRAFCNIHLHLNCYNLVGMLSSPAYRLCRFVLAA